MRRPPRLPARLLALLACSSLAAALPARAQEPGEPALRDVAPGPAPGPAARILPETGGDAVGTWDLSLDGTNRRCEIVLSGESGQDGRVLRFPAGCRRALPVLAEAAGWLFADKGIRIVDRNVYPLATLLPSPDGRSLRGRAANGQDYSLVPLQTLGMFPNAPPGPPPEAAPGGLSETPPGTPPGPLAAAPRSPVPAPAGAEDDRVLDRGPERIPDIAPSRAIPGSQPVLRSDLLVRPKSPPAVQAAAPTAAPSPPPASQPAAPGRRDPGRPEPGVYALDRFNEKDVCRIELSPRPASVRPTGTASRDDAGELAPARILPGCRDGGIAVFDPVSWRFASGHLTLKAKRGHAVNLVATGDGGWRRDPETGVTLVLRKVGP